jgi:hypothetical protein
MWVKIRKGKDVICVSSKKNAVRSGLVGGYHESFVNPLRNESVCKHKNLQFYT